MKKNFLVFLVLFYSALSGLAQKDVSQITMAPQEQFEYLIRETSNHNLDSIICSGWAPLYCGGWQLKDFLPPFAQPDCMWGPYTNAEVSENWKWAKDPEGLVRSLAYYTGVPAWLPPNFNDRYQVIAIIVDSRLSDQKKEIIEQWGDIVFRIRWPGYEISLEKAGTRVLLNELLEQDFNYLVGRIVYAYPTKKRRAEIDAYLSKQLH